MPYKISSDEMERYVGMCEQAGVDLPSAEHLEAHTLVARSSGWLPYQDRVALQQAQQEVLVSLVVCQAWQVINVVRDVSDGASARDVCDGASVRDVRDGASSVTSSWSQAWSATVWGFDGRRQHGSMTCERVSMSAPSPCECSPAHLAQVSAAPGAAPVTIQTLPGEQD